MNLIESFRDAFGRALISLGQKNENIVVLDADVKKSTATAKFAEKFPRRFIQMGISEQDLVSTAAGFAIAGKIPIASTFSIFLMRAWEQIRNTIARDNLNVKMVATHSGLSDYMDGSSHQAIEDLAIMRVIPNMTVVAPADALSTQRLLFDIVSIEGPAYMRIGRDYAPRVYDEKTDVKVGKINCLRDGTDVCIVACGIMVSKALKAAKALEKKGISAAVLDIHTIKPMDEKTLVSFARQTNGIVVAEEHNIIGGLGSAVSEILSEKYPIRIKKVGVRDRFGTCSRDYFSLLNHYGLTVENIIKAVEDLLK